MRYSYPDYRVYESRTEFAGTDVFELHPGEFPEGITYWNAGSVYVREEAFLPFRRMMLDVAPGFDWYGNERLDQRQCARLLRLLDRAAVSVRRAASAADLTAIDDRLEVTPQSFTIRKAQLTRMVAGLAAVAETALRRRVGLWVLGL